MFNFFKSSNDRFSSRLYDEKSFYTAFERDLSRAKNEVIIESPFISSRRMETLYPSIRKLVRKGVKTWIITRSPKLHSGKLYDQSEQAIQQLAELGVQVLVTKNLHHRKLAFIDRDILWEGSLNILSQNNSREIMRRISGGNHAKEMFRFTKIGRFIN